MNKVHIMSELESTRHTVELVINTVEYDTGRIFEHNHMNVDHY